MSHIFMSIMEYVALSILIPSWGSKLGLAYAFIVIKDMNLIEIQTFSDSFDQMAISSSVEDGTRFWACCSSLRA